MTKTQFVLLYSGTLVTSSGATALQSVMPAIGRTIGIRDFYVAIAFTWSAVLWVLLAPFWARKSDHHGRKALMLMGLIAFVISMTACGIVLFAGLRGWIAGTLTFSLFALFRGIYGGFGCATPTATQAYLASKTRRSGRVSVLAAFSSSSGLGTIIGPAVAPLFVLPVIGLAGPLFAFAWIGAAVSVLIMRWLPNDKANRPLGHGAAMSYPSLASMPTGASIVAATSPRPTARLSWRDPRISPWIIVGVIAAHAQTAIVTCIGFFVIDSLKVPADESQRAIAIVIMAGAFTTLGAQWMLIPRLALKPRAMIVFGTLISGVGLIATALSHDLYGISLGFAVASLGFGFTRPGFTAGASLAVRLTDQGAIAGIITCANGISYLLAPAIGIGLYEWQHSAPFLVFALLLIALSAICQRRLPA